LLEREKLARIIITGDFNHMLNFMMEGLKRLNIYPVISTEVATHRGGSQLDQVFTNQQVLDWGTGSIDEQISDHFPLRVTIQLRKVDGE
jgi:endonuclease/exonuclease/phosphatase family metal-dependent hydrolase